MNYAIKAHPTIYKGVEFRSRLEATWAAFFDLAGWTWAYEPIDLDGWVPDFRVAFPCGHSECPDEHTILASVKPFFVLKEFEADPQSAWVRDCHWGYAKGGEQRIPADATAWLGANPQVTRVHDMVHGPGGGMFDIPFWVKKTCGDWKTLWAQAGNITRWRPRG